MPATVNGTGEAKTTADLSEHPWAGAHVVMTLSAVGLSGKTGRSDPVELTLPGRLFHNPLARALVEQRRNLILDPDHAPKGVSTALTALAIAPELFDTSASIYLGLKQANPMLGAARTDPQLLEVAAFLWAMAEQLENGDKTQAERDLRAAEQALREALNRGASDEELKKLMQNLREAAQRFASEVARNNADQAQQDPQDSQAQAQDLDKLMDQMEDAARHGSREDAQAMLDQMQQMFENMRSAQQESPAERALRKQIGELEKMLRDQQALRDDTFRSDQRGRQQERKRKSGQDPSQPNGATPPGADQDDDAGQSADNGDDDPSASDPETRQLKDRQQALRDRLAELQKALKGLGMKGEKGFGEAEKHMQDAEGDLGGDNPGGKSPGGKSSGSKSRQPGQTGKGAAVELQGKALEALREGAKGLQQQLGDGQPGQGGKGQFGARGRRPGEQQQGDDPLGRGRGRDGHFGQQDGALRQSEGGAERARRVLEELRRRLADPSRPIEERDYLERLMKRD